jgi:hypothetical protein
MFAGHDCDRNHDAKRGELVALRASRPINKQGSAGSVFRTTSVHQPKVRRARHTGLPYRRNLDVASRLMRCEVGNGSMRGSRRLTDLKFGAHQTT